MGSGGGTETEFVQSPEARRMLSAIMPMVQGLGQYGTQRYFGGEPQMGAPSMSGVLTSQPMYDIPDPSSAMPTANWFNNLAPEIKAGLYAPYAEAGRGLMEAMGSRGQLGSQKAGMSAASGQAMGELAGQAAKNVGLSAWQMTSPMAMNAWGADLARNQQAYNVGQQERMADYNTAMNVWQMPSQMMGMAPQFMPQGIVQQQPNTMGNAFGGAASGALAGSMIMPGWGTAIGGGLGALTGLFS
jgi:hypothetical protein